MKHITLLLLGLLFIGESQCQAQEKKSYLYLEINKNLPVRVQLNDEIISNDNKGYIIIPQIKEGDNKLRFTFENPNFKTHVFTINNEPQKSQGLKLTRIADNKFVLQDVVNRKIIAENNMTTTETASTKTSNNNPVIASKQKSRKTKTVDKEGIVKVWEAGADGQATEASTRTNKANKKNKQAAVTKTVKSQPELVAKKAAKTTATQQPKKVLAMYENRQPLTAEIAKQRYKNYNKIKRAKRRSARLSALNKSVKTEKPKVQKNNQENLQLKEAKRIAKKKEQALEERKFEIQKKQLAAKKLEKEKVRKDKLLQKKQLKENKRRLAIEKKREAAERIEAQRLEEKMRDAEKQRLEKAKIEKSKLENRTAEKVRTKKIKSTKRNRKDKKKTAIEEQVINSEPLNNKEAPSSTRKNYETEDRISPIRCAFTVKPERITDWTRKLPKKFDDEARVNYVNRKLKDHCISTNNLGILLGNMETQIGRFKLIRTVYPKIEDRANMDRFYKYFQSKSYVGKIKELKDTQY